MDRKNPPCIKRKEVAMPIADDMDKNCYDTEKCYIQFIFVFQCFNPSETLNMDLWEVSGSLSFSFLVWMLTWYLNSINSSLLGILEVGYVIVFLDAKPQRTRRRRKPHHLVLWVGLSAHLGLNPNISFFFFLRPFGTQEWSLHDLHHSLKTLNMDFWKFWLALDALSVEFWRPSKPTIFWIGCV